MLGLTAIEFFIFSVAIFIIIYWITPRQLSWFPFVVLLALLTILAFKFEPNETDDLSRYFWVLDHFRENGKAELDWYISDGKYSWNVYRAMAYYFFAISRFSNDHMLPAVTIFICYGSMFLILNKFANRFNVSKWYLFLGAMFSISTYWWYDTASGIRNGLAFSIALLATYYHLVERKYIPLCYFLYFVAALSHSAGILPVIVVAVTVLTLNTSGKYMKYGIIFGIVGGAALLEFLATKTDNSFIQSFAGQSEAHEASTLDFFASGTMFKVNVVVLVIVILLLAYFSSYFKDSPYADELKRFYKYSSLLIYFLIGCMFSGLVFVRFVRWIIPTIGAMIYMIGMQLQTDAINKPKTDIRQFCNNDILSFKAKTKPIVSMLFIAFTCVHFWYLCAGSSLHWIHF